MTPRRSLVCMAIGVLFARHRALAGAANTMAAPAEEAHEKTGSCSASAATSILPTTRVTNISEANLPLAVEGQ